ncbi:MAG: DNA polymerase III subunit delta [Nitrospirales bacterium]|nr:DNA polymerase III subunit delta [Nitrospirales bacterium]
MSVKPHELPATLQRDGLAPLYVVAGEEAYLRDRAVQTIRSAAKQSSEVSDGSAAQDEQFFNYDVLYGDETDALEVLTIAREMSFFAARRLVIVTWAEKLPAKEGEALIPYFQHPAETTTLVVVAAKLDGRLKWVQQIKKHAIFIDCAPLYDNQRMGWITKQAAQSGVKLEENAAHMLKELSADGLYVTHSEIQKLSAYLSSGACATARDVEAIRGMEPGASVFDLSEAIGTGASGKALHIIAKNLETGEAPLRILGALIWQVRRVWKAKSLLQQGLAQPKIAREVGIPPFRAAEFFRQIQHWSDPQLRLAWDEFCQADAALKGSASASPKRVLDALVISLCGGSKNNRLEKRAFAPKRESTRSYARNR